MFVVAALFPFAAQRRWLRHFRLPECSSDVRHDRRFPDVFGRRSRPRSAGDDRTGGESHLRPASVVSGGAPGSARLARTQFLRLERYRSEIQRCADYFYGHRKIQLDVGPDRQAILLAPIFFSPAGSEFRQSQGPGRNHQGHALLAGYGRRRFARRRDSVS